MSQLPFTVVERVKITDAKLVSHDIPETDHPEWDVEETYAAKARVIIAAQHKIYESVIDANFENNPLETLGVAWLEVGPTNRWAGFDDAGNTSVSGAGPISFVVTGDSIDTIALTELYATSVRIQASSSAYGTYYDETIELKNRALVTGFYDWFFGENMFETQVIATDIPPVVGSTYTITVNGGAVSWGYFIMGRKSSFGFAQYDVQIRLIDLGERQENQFGVINFVKRGFRRRMEVTVMIENATFDSVFMKAARFRQTPALWIGAKGLFETMTMFGYYDGFYTTIKRGKYSQAVLNIESMNDV